MSDENDQCAVLVMSSDGYSDLWPTFFSQFARRWPTCPYPVFLGSNTATYHGHDFVTTVCSGPDRDWSASARSIVEQIPHAYLVILLEDLLIADDVASTAFAREVNFMRLHGTRHIQVACRLPADRVNGEGYGVVDRGAPYRVNVCGLWRKQSFLDLLLDGESPWNFEIMGSYRSSHLDGFLRMREPPLRLVNLVEKGLFLPAAVKYCRKQGIPLATDRRGIARGRRGLVSRAKTLLFNTMVRVPWRLRVSTMNVLRKLLVSY